MNKKYCLLIIRDFLDLTMELKKTQKQELAALDRLAAAHLLTR